MEIIPVGWTFEALAADAAALLGTALVTGVVFLTLALRIGPRVVGGIKRMVGR